MRDRWDGDFDTSDLKRKTALRFQTAQRFWPRTPTWWNRLKCWWSGHSYAVHHYFTSGAIDDVTCCRCGADLIWSDKQGWWVTR